MEKAILKTLIYADIFDYPLKAWEIHKWLVGGKASLPQVEKSLRKGKGLMVKRKDGYYFLGNKSGLGKIRIEREKHSQQLLKQAKFIAQIFKLIPWIKLVGISGSLAMENIKVGDDIDLFIITSKNRLWTGRLFLLLSLELLGKRRKRGELLKNTAGKVCINILLEEDSLAQKDKNIYIAHEVLQMRPLWSRDGIYQRYLEENEWVFKFLPNWTSTFAVRGPVSKQPQSTSSLYESLRALIGAPRLLPPLTALVDFIEQICRWLQLRYMGKLTGLESISKTALYFHPQDYSEKVLKEYQKGLKKLGFK